LRTWNSRVGFEGWEAGLVAIVVINAVGVCGAGHIAGAGAATSTVVIIARWTILDIEVVTTWIMHKVALADVNASRVKCVLVIVAAVVVVDVSSVVFATAAAIGSIGVGGACGACDADGACVAAGVAAIDGIGVEGVSTGFLNDIGSLIVVTYRLAFDAVVRVLVDVAVNLRLL